MAKANFRRIISTPGSNIREIIKKGVKRLESEAEVKGTQLSLSNQKYEAYDSCEERKDFSSVYRTHNDGGLTNNKLRHLFRENKMALLD